MGSHHIRVSAHTAAAPDVVFRFIADGASWPTWSPIDSFELEREGEDGGESIGAIRIFRTGRAVSRERIVAKVPGERFSYVLVSGLAIRNYRADLELEPDGEGTTIRWHSTFDSKLPGTGWLYRTVLSRFITRLVHGLASHAAAAAPQKS